MVSISVDGYGILRGRIVRENRSNLTLNIDDSGYTGLTMTIRKSSIRWIRPGDWTRLV